MQRQFLSAFGWRSEDGAGAVASLDDEGIGDVVVLDGVLIELPVAGEVAGEFIELPVDGAVVLVSAGRVVASVDVCA